MHAIKVLCEICMSGHIHACIVCYHDSGVHNLFYVVELNSKLFICVDTYVHIYVHMYVRCVLERLSVE